MMKKRILCLAMALMMMVGTFSTVQAKELVGKDHWKVSFGAYEYRLAYVDSQNNETLIYDSSTVGGDSSQGLKEIKGLDDYTAICPLGLGKRSRPP